MKCERCHNDFPEGEIQESHDVPCYLFQEKSSRRERKQLADKYKRRWLCIECHKEYEFNLNLELKLFSRYYAIKYFEGLE